MIRQRYLLKLYRNCATWVTSTQTPPTLTSKFCEDFNEFYPKFIDKAIERYKYLDHKYTRLHVKEISEHYSSSKLPLQGEFLMYAYELLEKPENINSDKLNQAYYLACASVAFQSYFLIQDDVYSNNKTRAEKTCWHLLPDSSPLAVNDSSMLRSFIHELLRQNIDQSKYNEVIDVFNEMYFAMETGQLLDISIPMSKEYNNFTMENYEKIPYIKASCYSISSQILLALILSNKANEATFELVKELSNKLGVLIQIHHDFTDYLERDKSSINKLSTDIANGKFTWMAVAALKNFNTKQRKIFNESYGNSDPEKIKRVIKLYDEVKMQKLYKEEVNARYETFMRKVRKLPANSTPSSDFFTNILKFFQSYAKNTSKYDFEITERSAK